jgi:hypothetical protein
MVSVLNQNEYEKLFEINGLTFVACKYSAAILVPSNSRQPFVCPNLSTDPLGPNGVR